MFDPKSLADPSMAIEPHHDGRHQLDGRPLAREASAYIVVLPEHEIAFFTYTYVSGTGAAGAKIAIFGPGVDGGSVQEKVEDRQVSPDMDFDDWTLDAYGMTQDLQFGHASIRWQSPGIELDYSFEASHPPYSYASDPRGCPSYCADDRIEQSGRIKGRLRFQGKTIELDTTGHRDHSWGTRDWMAMQHYEWFLGQVGDEVSVHFWKLQALGEEQLRGYVFKDGLIARIDSIDCKVEFDAAWYHQRYAVSMRDSAGRTTELTGTVFDHILLNSDPRMILREGPGSCTIDGRKGVGWLECMWPKAYLEHIDQFGPYNSVTR